MDVNDRGKGVLQFAVLVFFNKKANGRKMNLTKLSTSLVVVLTNKICNVTTIHSFLEVGLAHRLGFLSRTFKNHRTTGEAGGYFFNS